MVSYAYLGEVTPKEFSEIRMGFPNIVGIDADKDGNIVLGIDVKFGDEVIGIHQLIVQLWGDKEIQRKMWDALEDDLPDNLEVDEDTIDD